MEAQGKQAQIKLAEDKAKSKASPQLTPSTTSVTQPTSTIEPAAPEEASTQTWIQEISEKKNVPKAKKTPELEDSSDTDEEELEEQTTVTKPGTKNQWDFNVGPETPGSPVDKGKEKVDSENLPNKESITKIVNFKPKDYVYNKYNKEGKEDEDWGWYANKEMLGWKKQFKKKMKQKAEMEMQLQEIRNLKEELNNKYQSQPKVQRAKEMIITKRPKLDSFSGEGTEDVRTWISAFLARMDLAAWDEEQAKEELIFHLKGKALTWIHRESLGTRSLKAILQKMEDTFEPRNRSVAYALINDMKQEAKETVESYTQRFEIEAKNIFGPTEQQSKALSYVKGLRKEIYIKVSQIEPKDFESAVRLAKTQEKRVSTRDAYDKSATPKPKKKKVDFDKDSSEKKVSYINRSDESDLEMAVQKILEEQLPKIMESTMKGMQEKVKNINETQKNKQNNNKDGNKSERPTCEYCSKKGHIASNCYKKKRDDKNKNKDDSKTEETKVKADKESAETKN